MQSNIKTELNQLIKKYIQGTATEEEKLFLENYYQHFQKEPNLTESFSENRKESLRQQMLLNIEKQTTTKTKVIGLWQNKRIWWVAAALFIGVLSISIIYFNSFENKPASTAKANIIKPATDKAVLTLADGTTILLDSNGNTALSNQGNVQLNMNDGQLTYQGKTDEVQLNTMSTPRGGQYKLLLADGTKVWLNAQSSLTYPVAFVGNERKVTLTGEAYFEVAKNKQMPFRVYVENKGLTEVLGTQFNISAYPNDNKSYTTLIEGVVKIMPLNKSVPELASAKLLSPGQQAVATVNNNTIQINKDIDLNEILAWKNGEFYFENAKLETILEEFSRWYDIDIVYQCADEVKKRKFFMIVDRKTTLDGVLTFLKTTDVKYEIKDKKLIVK